MIIFVPLRKSLKKSNFVIKLQVNLAEKKKGDAVLCVYRYRKKNVKPLKYKTINYVSVICSTVQIYTEIFLNFYRLFKIWHQTNLSMRSNIKIVLVQNDAHPNFSLVDNFKNTLHVVYLSKSSIISIIYKIL